ncbi:MAG: signal recognition particle protein [Acidobacteria bacterium]|nr:signal recognition particle protein [Acidobacteriota bacterium]
MFDRLGTRLETIFSKLRGYGKITKADVEAGLREIRIAFLEADVNFKVVKSFIDVVREKALGERVFESLTPGQQVVKIVKDEMTAVLGADAEDIKVGKDKPAILMLAGLQGSGKTTTAGKLALRLKDKNLKSLLVSTDVYRPAAIEQLRSLAKKSGLDFYEADSDKPLKIADKALSEAKKGGYDLMIVDTAGRLHIDEEMMKEAKDLSKLLKPHEIFYVADSMTGQDAVTSALAFHESLPLTGVVLTKLDGDARGGAAFSIKSVTGVPLRFIGVGEKVSDLELFHPDRLVSRILGMGDVLTLIEKAEATIDQEEAEELTRRMLKDEMTLDDFAKQLKQLKQMGPISQVASMLPGMGKNPALKNLNVEERDIKRVEAIISSMTPKERQNHQIINGSRRKRIARGSGTTVEQINQLLKQFAMMKKMMKNMGKFGLKGKRGIIDFSAFK